MDRRSFMLGILAAAAAPAIVRADSLMRVVARDTTVITCEIGRYESIRFLHPEPYIRRSKLERAWREYEEHYVAIVGSKQELDVRSGFRPVKSYRSA